MFAFAEFNILYLSILNVLHILIWISAALEKRVRASEREENLCKAYVWEYLKTSKTYIYKKTQKLYIKCLLTLSMRLRFMRLQSSKCIASSFFSQTSFSCLMLNSLSDLVQKIHLFSVHFFHEKIIIEYLSRWIVTRVFVSAFFAERIRGSVILRSFYRLFEFLQTIASLPLSHFMSLSFPELWEALIHLWFPTRDRRKPHRFNSVFLKIKEKFGLMSSDKSKETKTCKNINS